MNIFNVGISDTKSKWCKEESEDLIVFQQKNNFLFQMDVVTSFKVEQVQKQANQFQTGISTYLNSINIHYKVDYPQGSVFRLITFGHEDVLGALIEYTMINRPFQLVVKIQITPQSLGTSLSNQVTFGSLEEELDNIQGYPHKERNPLEEIRVIHIHAHFDKSSESFALKLFKDIKIVVGSTEITSSAVRYQKNGPHDKNSWEIHVRDRKALGRAVVFLAENSLHEEVFHPFHCRTFDSDSKMKPIKDNEYNDHVYRLGWIGKVDPLPLDINFFKKKEELKEKGKKEKSILSEIIYVEDTEITNLSNLTTMDSSDEEYEDHPKLVDEMRKIPMNL